MIRRWLRRLAIALVSCVVLAVAGYGALFIPSVYFRVAVVIIQRNALMRDRVDWVAVRSEADRLLQGARSTRDTYPAIQLVLQRLGDHHSHLALPETVRAMRAGANLTLGLTAIWPECIVAAVSPGGPAERSGVRAGDIVEAVDGEPPAHVLGVLCCTQSARSSERLTRSRIVTGRLRGQTTLSCHSSGRKLAPRASAVSGKSVGARDARRIAKPPNTYQAPSGSSVIR
jgi:hypothetical protein